MFDVPLQRRCKNNVLLRKMPCTRMRETSHKLLSELCSLMLFFLMISKIFFFINYKNDFWNICIFYYHFLKNKEKISKNCCFREFFFPKKTTITIRNYIRKIIIVFSYCTNLVFLILKGIYLAVECRKIFFFKYFFAQDMNFFIKTHFFTILINLNCYKKLKIQYMFKKPIEY